MFNQNRMVNNIICSRRILDNLLAKSTADPNLLLQPIAENQSDEGEKVKHPRLKINVQDTDDVRKVISHSISLMPSIRRILDNLLAKSTADPNLLLQPMAENQSDEGEKDTDDVRKVISHTISLMPSRRKILDNLLAKRTADPKPSASSHGRKPK
ncbi:unnamed protein product [Mytilus coruscus]|uniref:Uncharacterized protein n=1 Tax=Mytilus coruscus TaxID=42192 RepID=A0A6J8D9S5_MYTCO|nr:unnamed protein product [Mytilus coruscus]